MRKLIATILGVFLIFSCNTLKLDKDNIAGVFCRKGSDKYGFKYEYKLELNRDKSFKLVEKMQDANPSCEGLWSVHNDTIILKCNEVKNVTDMLTNGYMNKREQKVKVMSINKLSLDNIILRRVK